MASHTTEKEPDLVTYWHLLQLIALLLTMASCASPFLVFPGEGLKGRVNTTSSFCFVRNHQLLALETMPDDPYSVFVRARILDSRLYIESAGNRRWGRNIQLHPQVRIKVTGAIYEAHAIRILAPDLLQQFRKDRQVYRLDPRDHEPVDPGRQRIAESECARYSKPSREGR